MYLYQHTSIQVKILYQIQTYDIIITLLPRIETFMTLRVS